MKRNSKKFKTRRKLPTVITVFILALGLIFIYFILQGQEAKAEWFDESWIYRQKITANNNSDFDATNVPYKILVDTSTLITGGKMQSDGDDIRIIDENGQIVRFQTEESTLNTSETGIWFEATVKNNSLVNYYLYYGNPSASSLSFSSDVESESGDGATVEMKDGFGYSTNTEQGKLSDVRKNGTNLGVNGSSRHTNSYPGNWWNDRAFARTLLAIGPLFVEVQFEDTNYGNYSSFGTIVKMFNNGFVACRVYMNYNNSGTENLYYYLSFDNGTRNSVWVNGSGTLIDQAEDSGTLYEADLGDSWFGQRWTATGHYGGTIVTENNSDWNRGHTSAQSSYFQTNYSYSEAYSNGESREIRFATFAGDGGLNEMSEKGSLYGANSTSLDSEEQFPGPVAYWKFDEGYGTTAYDSTQNTNNGTLGNYSSSDPEWKPESECVSGKCLYFNGTATTGGYVNAGIVENLASTTDITVSAWINLKQLHSDYQAVSSDTWTKYYLGINPDSRTMWFNIRKTDSSQVGSGTYTLPETDKWYHVAGVASETNGYVRLYVNGVQVKNNSTSFTIRKSAGNVIVGADGTGSAADYFNGFIDEVKIYLYARSAEQIKADYLSGSAGTGGFASSAVLGGKPQKWLSDGLVGYWKMDENSWGTPNCSDEVVLDSSGNDNGGKACPVTTGPTGVAVGKFGNGGDFDGSDDYVKIDNLDIHDSTYDNSTVSIWFKKDSSGRQMIWSMDDGGYDKTLEIDRTADNQICAFRGSDHGCVSISNYGWIHAVIVYYDDNTLSLYVNGEIQSNKVSTSFGTSQGYFAIGNDGETGEQFDGKIDEIRIYNRALSDREIRDLYNWAPGPVAYYNFNSNTNDSSGSNINFTTTKDYVVGKFGKALEFEDGTVGTTASTNILDTDTHTIEFWIQFTGYTSGWQGIFNYKPAGSNRSPGIWRHTSGRMLHWRYDPDNSGADIYLDGVGSGTQFSDNTWYHIAGIKNSSSFSAYVDGVYVGSVTVSNPKTSGSSSLYFGSAEVNLDDFRIYNYTRTQKQIIEDMNAGHPAVGSPVGSAKHYWKLDELSGTTVNDSGNNPANGTFDGTYPPSWTTSGKFGGAIDCEADNTEHVDLGNIVETENTMTVSVWIKPESLNGGWIIGEGASFRIKVETDGDITFWLRGNNSGGTDTNDQTTTATMPISTGSWHHIVGIWNGTTTDRKIYVNGKLEIDGSTNVVELNGDSNNATICDGYNGDPTVNFDGLIDEIKIYSFALTQDEIKLDYNRGAAVLLGAVSTDSSGNPDWSSEREYCIPGDTTSCSAPVAEWKFDEKTGTTANDTSGNGNTGTITNATWKGAGQCKSGACLDLDANNEYVNCGDSSSLNSPETTNEITVEGWIKISSLGSKIHTIAQKGNDEHYGFWLGPDTRGGGPHRVWWEIGDGTAGYNQCNPNYSFSSNTWYYIAGVYDGTDMKVYVNGKEEDSCNKGISMVFNSNPLYIGYFSSSHYTTGKIDHVKIYDYARTPAQIAWDYNRGGPVGWWKFDENQGMTAYDSSGNSNNSTLESSMTSDDWVEGKYNTALDFDGGDYVEISQNNLFNFVNEDFTIKTWIKPNSWDNPSSDSRTIVDFETAGWNGWLVRYSEGINGIALGGGGTERKVLNTLPLLDEWSHITVTYSESNTEIRGYLNGKLDKMVSENLNLTNSTNNHGIGNNVENTLQGFDGQIDDVRIYNYALTQEQIKNVMNQDSAIRFGPREGSP